MFARGIYKIMMKRGHSVWLNVARAGQRLRGDRRAVVAIITTLYMIPIMGLVGLGVDMAFVTQAESVLDLAADAAALSAAKTAANAYSSGTLLPTTLGQAAGLQWFTAQTKLMSDATVTTPTISVTQSGTTFPATVTYKGTVSLYFGLLFGINTAAIGHTAVSTMTSNTYINITFLLDNSPSMLLASTEAGITQLQNLTLPFYNTYHINVPGSLNNYPCAFACHWQTNGQPDFYTVARSNNIQLRTDVLKLATQNALTTMQQAAVVPNQFGLDILLFDVAITPLYPPLLVTTTTDIADATAAVNAMPMPWNGDTGFTNFPAVMSSFVSTQTASGNGTTPLTPQKVLIIVTDGMDDYGTRVISNGGTEGPFNPSSCNAIKALGFTVYVLYTPYSSDTSALIFNEALQPMLTGTPNSTMDQALSACASSPQNFTDAAQPADIVTALNTLLLAAIGTAGRFTQ
jgi:Flp pilus assembly protein TadG